MARALGPPSIALGCNASHGSVRSAVARLDPDRRLGNGDNPRFLTARSVGAAVRPDAPVPARAQWSVAFLGLTPDSGRWLDAAAGAGFAAARRAELGGVLDGAAPDVDSAGAAIDQVVLAVAAGLRAQPNAAVELGWQPLPFGAPGNGSGVAFSRDPHTGARGLAGSFRPGGTGLDLLIMGGTDLGEAAPWPWLEWLAKTGAAAERAAGHPVRLDFVVDDGRVWVGGH